MKGEENMDIFKTWKKQDLIDDSNIETIQDDNGCDLDERQWRLHVAMMEQWIPIDRIRVRRERYQREASPKTVKRVSGEFDWYQFDRIWVTHSNDGYYYATDGGGRLEGLKKKGYRGCVCCNVMPDAGIKGEAKAFLNQNENSDPVSAYERYVAALDAEEEWALDIQSILEKHGLIMTSGRHRGNMIACSDILRDIWYEKGKTQVARVVDLARTIMPKDVEIFHNKNISALNVLIKQADKQGNVDLSRFKILTKDLRWVELELAMMKKKTKLSGEGGNSKAFREVLRDIYNKGLRKSEQWIVEND